MNFCAIARWLLLCVMVASAGTFASHALLAAPPSGQPASSAPVVATAPASQPATTAPTTAAIRPSPDQEMVSIAFRDAPAEQLFVFISEKLGKPVIPQDSV